jgi:hypothetical protein
VSKSTKIYSSLAETFDVEDVVDTASKSDIVDSNALMVPDELPPSKSLEDDADVVRNTLHSLLKQGEEAFADLKRIAVAEESPRSFEVLNGMLSNLSDIAVKLMDVHEKKAKINRLQETKTQPQPGTTVNNTAVFVGTTSDLQQMIKRMTMEK